jgi:hypothetical protein
MASLGNNFDPNAVEPDTGGRGDPIPEGRYVLQVIESDVVDNKKGTGQILKLTLEVFDGPLKGRKMFENINITNESVQAQEIGQKQLSALCHAAGITTVVSDSQELHYQPFEADVSIEGARSKPGGGEYPPQNRIKKYHFAGAEGAAPATPAARPAAARTAPPAANTGRPWTRKAS